LRTVAKTVAVGSSKRIFLVTDGVRADLWDHPIFRGSAKSSSQPLMVISVLPVIRQR
jgi:hypothetical protein